MTRQSGMTLLETVISVVLLIVVLGLAFGSLDATAKTATVASSLTDAQLRAESVLRAVRDQLRTAGASGPSALVITDPAGKAILVEYSPVDQSAPIFDPADPYKSPFIAGERRVIRFEATFGEALDNGVDDDKDGRVDEGQLTLYRRGTPDTVIALLAPDVTSFGVVLDANPSPYPRLWLNVAVEQRIPVAPGPTGTLSSARHEARAMLTLLN